MLHLFWRNIRGREELSSWRNGTMGNGWRDWHWEWVPLVLEGQDKCCIFLGPMSSTTWFHVLCQDRLADCKKTRSHYINIRVYLKKKINWLKILTLLKLTNGYIIWKDWLSRKSFTMTALWGGFVILTKLRTRVIAGSILLGGSNGTSAEWVLVVAAGYSGHPIYSNSQAWFQSPGHNL